MKIECFSHSIRLWYGIMKNHILAILLILSAPLTVDIRSLSSETLPQSIAILYSNNINAEIDPCPV